MMMLDIQKSPEEGQQAVTILNDEDNVGGEEIGTNHNNNTATSNNMNIEETEEIVPSYAQQPFYRKHKQLTLIAICTLVIIVIVAVSVPLTKDTRSNSSNNEAEWAEKRLGGSGISTTYPTTTTYPSQAPSNAMRNWDLNYLGMDVDFGIDSPHEIVVQYEMGINRQYEVELLAFDCESPIAGILNRPLSIINITSNVESIENDDKHEMLTLQYDLDKSLLSSSNIWNTETNEVQLCSVVRLIYYPDSDGETSEEEEEPWIITQDKRKINIYVDLTVGFTVGDGDDSNSGGAGFGFEIELEPLGNATDADSNREEDIGG